MLNNQYAHEKSGIALGVLTQKLGSDVGPDQRPVAYFSKQLDSITLGWPSNLDVPLLSLHLRDQLGATLPQTLVPPASKPGHLLLVGHLFLIFTGNTSHRSLS